MALTIRLLAVVVTRGELVLDASPITPFCGVEGSSFSTADSGGCNDSARKAILCKISSSLSLLLSTAGSLLSVDMDPVDEIRRVKGEDVEPSSSEASGETHTAATLVSSLEASDVVLPSSLFA